MARRDQRIDHLQNELHVQEGLTQKLKTQIKDLNDRFRVVDEKGVRDPVFILGYKEHHEKICLMPQLSLK